MMCPVLFSKYGEKTSFPESHPKKPHHHGRAGKRDRLNYDAVLAFFRVVASSQICPPILSGINPSGILSQN